MPFTLSHAAAVLPFRRRLIPSALVVGALAPDFEYFLRLSPADRFGHTLLGAFMFTLPVALAVLWMFQRLIKVPVVQLMPDALQRRMANHIDAFRFGPGKRFLLIIVSLLLGITTHLLWDSFTHPTTWLYYHWGFLRHPVHLPVLGWVGYYKLLQHLSTVAGLGILLGWFAHWYETTKPVPRKIAESLSAQRKIAMLSIMTAVAILGTVLRLEWSVVGGPVARNTVVGQAVVTLIALGWWELIIHGLLAKSTRSPHEAPLGESVTRVGRP